MGSGKYEARNAVEKGGVLAAGGVAGMADPDGLQGGAQQQISNCYQPSCRPEKGRA